MHPSLLLKTHDRFTVDNIYQQQLIDKDIYIQHQTNTISYIHIDCEVKANTTNELKDSHLNQMHNNYISIIIMIQMYSNL